MLKMVVESWKREGMSREDFLAYLASVHGPLVRKHGPALGFRKYIQNIRLPSPEIDAFAEGRNWSPAPDASVELWFDSAEQMAAAFASPEAAEASAVLEEDERKFVDPSRISAFLSHEEVIFDYIAPGARFADNSKMVKMVVQVWKHPDLTLPEYLDRWRIQHGNLVRQHAKPMGFLRYVQSHPIPSPAIAAFAKERGWRQAPEGLTEVWWESEEAMLAAFASPEAAKSSAILAADEVKFINPPKISAFLAREQVVFDMVPELA